MKKPCSLALALVMALTLAVPAMAADKVTAETMNLADTKGKVTVKDSAGKEKTVRKGLSLYNGYTITTGADGSVAVNLDDSAAVKLGANGEISVKKSGKKLEVQLTAGTLTFETTRKRNADESFVITDGTTNLTGVRGSFGWAKPGEVGLMHGNATVAAVENGSGGGLFSAADAGARRAVDLTSGQMTRFPSASDLSGADARQAPAAPTAISLADIPALMAEDIANDPAKQGQIAQDVPSLNVQEIIDSLPEKQAAEQQAAAEQQRALEAAVRQQAQTIAALDATDAAAGVSNTLAFGEPERETRDSDSSSDSGRDSGYVPPAPPVKRTAMLENTTAGELNSYLTKYDVVTVTGGSFADAEVTVPAGKTLIFTTNAVSLAGVTNLGTLNAEVDIESGGTFNNKGGTVDVKTYFTNNGTVINNGRFTATHFINSGANQQVLNYSMFTATEFLNGGTFYHYGGTCNASFQPRTADERVYSYELELKGVNGDANKTVTLMANSAGTQVNFNVSGYSTDPSGKLQFSGWRDANSNPVNADDTLNMVFPETGADTATAKATYTASWETAKVTVNLQIVCDYSDAQVNVSADYGSKQTDDNEWQLTFEVDAEKRFNVSIYGLGSEAAVSAQLGAGTEEEITYDGEGERFSKDFTLSGDEDSYTLTIRVILG